MLLPSSSSQNITTQSCTSPPSVLLPCCLPLMEIPVLFQPPPCCCSWPSSPFCNSLPSSLSISPFSLHILRSDLPPPSRKHSPHRWTSTCSNPQLAAAENSQQHAEEGVQELAILMEVEGVVADMHRFGHRHAFNVAFQKLGLDCANWTEPIYADLLRQAGGNEERMLSAFFERIGWPMALPTAQKGAFVQNLIHEKQGALEDRVAAGSLSLRPGVESFVDEVLEAGMPLVVLAAYNKSGENVARSLIQKLGTERTRKITFVGRREVEDSAYGQVVLGAGSSMGPDEELAIEAARAVAAEKQRMAEEVASMLKLSVEVDTSFVKISRKAIAALRAGAEVAGVSVQHCILLAGGHVGVQAAHRIGMPCVAVRSSLTARAEFPAARAVLEGFGAGSLTLTRLRKFL